MEGQGDIKSHGGCRAGLGKQQGGKKPDGGADNDTAAIESPQFEKEVIQSVISLKWLRIIPDIGSCQALGATGVVRYHKNFSVARYYSVVPACAAARNQEEARHYDH